MTGRLGPAPRLCSLRSSVPVIPDSSNIEIWEVRWDYDPAFDNGQAWCPDWCNYDVENVGGICSVLYPGYQCDYYSDSPQFRQRLTTWQGMDSTFSAKNQISKFRSVVRNIVNFRKKF